MHIRCISEWKVSDYFSLTGLDLSALFTLYKKAMAEESAVCFWKVSLDNHTVLCDE